MTDNLTNNNINIGVIACDLRHLYMAKMLATLGYNIHIIYSGIFESDKNFKSTLCNIVYDSNLDNINIICDIYDFINISDILIGPVPMNKISEFIILPKFISHLKAIKNNILLFGGMVDNETSDLLTASNIKFIDYMKSDALTTYNTIATAEGIIAEAIINKNTNLHGSSTLVLGFGRCAKTLAHKLSGLSAQVTIAARKESDLAYANSLGYKTIKLKEIKNIINKYEFIFNTIPATILNAEVLRNIDKSSLILDIASLPGGVDKNAALENSLTVIHSLGIPGRFAPKSSGEAIGRYIVDIISQHCLHNLNM